MKKLAASLLSLGILFSGFSNVQAEKLPVKEVTYEIWDGEYAIDGDSLINQWITEMYGLKWADRIPDERFTYAIVYPQPEDQNYNRDNFNLYQIQTYLNYESIKEAEAVARQEAQAWVQEWNQTYADQYGYTMVFVDPNVPEEPTKPGNRYAYGHDKDKAQGKAVGHGKEAAPVVEDTGAVQ